METSLHQHIVYSTDIHRLTSPAFYDCIVHLLCTAGSASLRYNGQRVVLSSGNIAVLSKPGLVEVEHVDADFCCEYIAAPDRFLHNLLPANNYSIQGCVSLFSNPIIEVSAADAERFSKDLEHIRLRMDDTGHRFYGEMMGGLLQAMIYDLFDFHTRTNENILTTDRVGYITAQFFAMIEAGCPKTQREVAYYAQELSVTPKYLSDTIKRVTGRSVSSHINRSATAIIIEYLNDSQLSITQIADRMHFASISYFSRYCTKHIGMSPAQYRLSGPKK